MDESQHYDIVVVGGGIIGCAAAMALSKISGISLAVVEKESTLAAHQTGNNSGVIHSGLYYRPGSLKARNCKEGREALIRFCEAHGVTHECCGKIVVATADAELASLQELERRGQANGLTGLRRLTPEEIREREPHINGIAGLLVPETGIVDFKGATRSFARCVEEKGGGILLHTRLLGIERDSGGLVLETTQGAIRTKNLINCGGLHSDRIARMCGVSPGVKIVPFRGEYYELAPKRRHLVNHLVYPVPNPQFPFLGVHFTRMALGGVEAGPNAVLALRREGYSWGDISAMDILSYLLYPGFWRLALRYWRIGFGEIFRSLSKRAFVHSLKKLMPDIAMSDVTRAGAGVRAQALDPAGRLLDDFRIVSKERMIHVLNAPSPAATASLSIGWAIARLAQETFDL